MTALSRSPPGSVPRGDTSGALAPGTWLGKHQLLHRLAIGGMAEIYLARATGIEQFEKLLVLKRMLPQHAADHRFIQMFLDEARLAATLSHPNIAHVYDIGGGDGHYYFTMEYVHGEDVASLLQAAGGAVPRGHALTIATGVAAGLHAAHDKRGPDGALLGVVHRDVSPSNILVGYDGCVKLVDFGIAKLAAQPGRTRTGGFLGKIRYSSPEHVQGLPLDRRSDVFALGVVLFELTCGARPFDGDTDFAVMQAIVHRDPPRPRDLVADYPEPLEAIVLRALRRDRDARFATAQDLQLALEDFARQHGVALSSVALSAYLGERFGDKLAAWRDAERAGRTLTEHVITAMTGGTVDLSALDVAALPAPGPEPVPRAARRARRGIALAVAGIAAAVGLGSALRARSAEPAGAASASTTTAVGALRARVDAHGAAAQPAPSDPVDPAIPASTAALESDALAIRASRTPDAPAAADRPTRGNAHRATDPGRSTHRGPGATAVTPTVDERRAAARAPASRDGGPSLPAPSARPRAADGKPTAGAQHGRRDVAAPPPAQRTQPWDPDSPLEP